MECEQKCHHLNKVLLFNHQTVYQTNSLLTPDETPKTVKVICIKCFKEGKTSQWFTARNCFLPGLDFRSSQMTLPRLLPLPLVTVSKTLSKALRNTQQWFLRLSSAMEPSDFTPFWNKPLHPQAFSSVMAGKLKSLFTVGGTRKVTVCLNTYLPINEFKRFCSTVCVWDPPYTIIIIP